jgi:hypothetical protein
MTSITINPENPSMDTGGELAFSATGGYSDGSSQNVTTQVNWHSSNSAFVSIDEKGVAHGQNAGSATITITVTSKDVRSQAKASTKIKVTTRFERNREANVEHASKEFGSSGTEFNKLKGSDQLNKRQKDIFDQKLKQAIEATPDAQDGPLSEAQLKELAQKAADQATALAKTPLGDDVNKLAGESETLKDNLVDLQNSGWTIQRVPAGQKSYTDRPNKIIYVAQEASAKDVAETLAHETGHAEYTKPPDPSVEDHSPTIAKGKAFIRKSVENSLLDEGQAQIVACKTAKELEAKGETGINIPGGHSDEYKAVYDKIEAGTLTMDKGRIEMAKIMATEVVSGPGNRNYVDYYSDQPRAKWNSKHPDAQVPATPRVDVFL